MRRSHWAPLASVHPWRVRRNHRQTPVSALIDGAHQGLLMTCLSLFFCFKARSREPPNSRHLLSFLRTPGRCETAFDLIFRPEQGGAWFAADCVLSQPFQSLFGTCSASETLRHSRGLGQVGQVSGRAFPESQQRKRAFGAAVSARYFSISVSAGRRPVRCVPEAGLQSRTSDVDLDVGVNARLWKTLIAGVRCAALARPTNAAVPWRGR